VPLYKDIKVSKKFSHSFKVRIALLQWKYIYNCVSPNYSLGYKAPLQLLKVRCVIEYINPNNADIAHNS